MDHLRVKSISIDEDGRPTYSISIGAFQSAPWTDGGQGRKIGSPLQGEVKIETQ